MFALKTLRLIRPAPAAVMLIGAVIVTACSKPVPKTEDIRPVRVLVLSSSNADVNAEFSGEVRARVESRLGFQVAGKVIGRKVDPGAQVKRGQVLMQLDPQDLQLSQAQAQASLRGAETNRDLARAELKRYQELRAQNFVSQAVLDSKETTLTAAQSNVDAAQAALRGQSNQARYASLLADVDGVVTAVDADVGQVVAPGTPVVRLAKSGDKEVLIGIPEDKVEIMRHISDVQVRLWADPQHSVAGKIREVSPAADPATRTYAVKVSLPDSYTEARLGMTAVVRFSSQTAAPQIKVPLTALYYEKSTTSVWLAENGAVRLVPVTVGGVSGNDILLAGGIKAGQSVVTAGVNLLKPGQKVKILGDDLTGHPVAPGLIAAGNTK
ncbi:efflux RND transporter periplasmic adaptor subunit [Janthinobacterium agaricidamnosum]|uniref:Efflux transporter, RND family, MFP subunit n=1 Tax=Janthinobacterium agaricidamnosum NBRC 102515 = DSM 9628 TaxID=1349767 RepID=W0V6Y6_9BURK|nr:efflux RND transporter periplasmic adaptor subunit [Janthinobacterium agaricidamnosum]CDG83017.1 efflux transporter, RND family, MFP subunit [Janthinobacterium agaricidamnosum NBRC 102515 = DSM 9628]